MNRFSQTIHLHICALTGSPAQHLSSGTAWKRLEILIVFCLLNWFWDYCQILHTNKLTWAFFLPPFTNISKTVKKRKQLVEIRKETVETTLIQKTGKK